MYKWQPSNYQVLWRWVRIRAWFLRWADVRARSWLSLSRASQQQNPIRAQSQSPCLLAQPVKQVALGSYKPAAEKSLVGSRSLLGQWPGFLVDWSLSLPLCLGTVLRLWASVFLCLWVVFCYRKIWCTLGYLETGQNQFLLCLPRSWKGILPVFCELVCFSLTACDLQVQ